MHNNVDSLREHHKAGEGNLPFSDNDGMHESFDLSWWYFPSGREKAGSGLKPSRSRKFLYQRSYDCLKAVKTIALDQRQLT